MDEFWDLFEVPITLLSGQLLFWRSIGSSGLRFEIHEHISNRVPQVECKKREEQKVWEVTTCRKLTEEKRTKECIIKEISVEKRGKPRESIPQIRELPEGHSAQTVTRY